jgi:hypothetical protein
MIKHFEDGEAWSSALAAYKELEIQYETNTFDFAKLARTQRAIATIYETIGKSEKLVPKYFKVVYKGLGFPASLRDKEFVFEGSPTERTSAFTDRMQEQYPAAQIVTSEQIDDVEGQFLVVSSLTPHRDLGHRIFQRARVTQAIRDYLLSSQPQAFSVTSKRNTSGPVTEHYAEKIVYTTVEPFPTILRRSEIISAHEVRLSAKETALERIVRKTAEMTAVEKKLANGEGDDEATQLLVDAVKISVNPISESSVVCYRQLIPSSLTPGDASPKEHSEDDDEAEPVSLDPQENAIKMALVDHAIMIKRCLAMFAKSGNEILTKHHEDLQNCEHSAFRRMLPTELDADSVLAVFESTFASEIKAFAPPQPVREPPTSPSPTWSRSQPPNNPATQPQQRVSSSLSNGNATDEVSIVQPVSLRQGRGARLSFLGTRKKDQQLQPAPLVTQRAHTKGGVARQGNGENESVPNTLSRSRSKESRRAFFHSRPAENRPGSQTNGTDCGGSGSADWVTDSGGVEGSDGADMEKEKPVVAKNENLVGSRVGSVRRRLSKLKLGKKSSKGSELMGSVSEE